MYQIIFISGLEKDLKSIPKTDQKRLLKKIESLTIDPFPVGCKALQGNLSGYHRIRSGHYRIIYNVNKERVTILILKIGHRGSIYE